MSTAEYLIAFPASNRLANNSQQLIEKLEAGAIEPQNELCVLVAHDFADEVLRALLLNSLENDRVSKMNKGILTQLAKVVSKSTHFMINKVLAKLSNAEMLPLAQYIDKTRITIESENELLTMIVCPLSEDDKLLFDDIKAASLSGNGVSEQAKVGRFIQAMSESAIDHFMREPTQLIKLGVISGKLVETTYHAVRKGTSSAVKKAAANMGEQDIANFVEDTLPKIMMRPA